MLIRRTHSPLPPADWSTHAGVAYASIRRRPYWSLRYTDGRIVNEWDVDWSQAPPTGRQRLRLYCPDGQYGEFGGTTNGDGRFVQFKTAIRSVHGSGLLSHVVGYVWGLNGEATFCAWEFAEDGGGRRMGPWDDNVYAMAYHHLGQLNADHLGLADGEGR